MILGRLKSYGLYILSGLLAVVYFMLRIKSHQVDSLKLEAQKVKTKALEKQRERTNEAIKASILAQMEGEKRVKEAVDRANSGDRSHFE